MWIFEWEEIFAAWHVKLHASCICFTRVIEAQWLMNNFRNAKCSDQCGLRFSWLCHVLRMPVGDWFLLSAFISCCNHAGWLISCFFFFPVTSSMQGKKNMALSHRCSQQPSFGIVLRFELPLPYRSSVTLADLHLLKQWYLWMKAPRVRQPHACTKKKRQKSTWVVIAVSDCWIGNYSGPASMGHRSF